MSEADNGNEAPTGDLSDWEIGGHRTMQARADGKSDGLYADLPSETLLERFNPGDEIRVAAWNESGDRTMWTARVHQSGKCISIPEPHRRALDLDIGDEIVWGVAPLGAPAPDVNPRKNDSSSPEVATSNVQQGPALEYELERKQQTLDVAEIGATSELQESLRSEIKGQISEARFRDELSWRQIAGVLEDIHADVAEQAEFDN